MFYEAFEIDSLLICKICNKKLDDPRILPCGKSFCNKCVESIFDSKTNKVNCSNCGDVHDKPSTSGFPQNLEVAKIVRLKSNEVFRGKLVKDFKEKSNIVLEKAEQFQKELDSGEMSIRDQCAIVRNETKQAIDEAHCKLDEFFKQFTKEIDIYETECQKELELIQQKRVDLSKVIDESNEYHKKSQNILKQFQYDESELKNLIDEGDKLLDTLEKTNDKIKCDIFNNVKLKFIKNLDHLESSLIGQIKRQDMNLYFLENMSNFNELDLLPKLPDINQETPLFTVEPFKTSKILCVYRAKNKNLNISCLNKEGKILMEQKCLINDEKFLEIKYFQCYTLANVNACIYTEEKHSNQTTSLLYKLRSYDKNLNLISSLELKHSIEYFATHGSILFSASKDSKKDSFYILTMYSPKLEPIQKIGQGNKLLPFYFPDTLLSFFVSENYFIINEPIEGKDFLEKITIINRSKGTVENTFNAKPFNDCSIYLGKYILLFNLGSKTIYAYDFAGGLIDETKLDEKLQVDILTFCLNKKVYFLNENKIKLYAV
jgi:hypothetical protein